MTIEKRSLRVTPWDAQGSLTPAQRLLSDFVTDSYEHHHRPLDGRNDTVLVNGAATRRCPRCGSRTFFADGTSPAGVSLFRCNRCGRQFTPATGTALESRGLLAAELCAVVRGLLGFQSISSVARATVHTRKTVRYVLERVFAVLRGVQDGVTLGGGAWIDETYYPVRERDKLYGPGGRSVGGHSNCDCICVGVGGGASVFLHAGRGDQNAATLKRVYGPHLERGCVLYHDANAAHGPLVRSLGLKDAKVFGYAEHAKPEGENVLAPVDRRCDTVQRWLSSHRGFDRAYLQDWLNLLWVVENAGDDPLEQTEHIINLLINTPARTRSRKPSRGEKMKGCLKMGYFNCCFTPSFGIHY